MFKARLAIIAGLLFALMGFAFWTARPGPGLKLRFLQAEQMGEVATFSFEVTNLPRHFHGLFPARLERLDSSTWKQCPNGIIGFSQTNGLGDRPKLLFTCITKALPPRTPLRLVVNNLRPRRGLHSFWLRLKVRLTGLNNGVSLNPFDQTPFYYEAAPGEVISDEFTAP